MSSNTMLKQAIIDANALREVALKNAEAIVVEKYSNQIKEAVDTMLEQEEEELEMGAEEEMGAPMDAGTGEALPSSRVGSTEAEPGSELGDQTSLAAVDGERLCPCPEDGATVEIDFAGLQDMMKQLDVEDAEGGPPPPMGDDELMPGPGPEAVEGEEEEDEELMLEIDDLLKDGVIGNASAVETAEGEEDEGEAANAFAGNIAAIAEDDSDVGVAGGEEPSEIVQELAESLRKKNKRVLRENTKLTKTNSKMLKENKQLLKEQNQLLKQNKEMKNLLKKLSGKLEEVNLSNAKLIYTNQVLNGASLNERQKQRIVESINSADSVEAARSIFETLQSAVGSSLQSKDKSQSLSEAIVRGNATTLRQKQKQTRQDPHIERMKKLAGI